MIIDFLFGYLGISSLIAFSYIFIFDNSYYNVLIISSLMDLFYFNYFIVYLSICYFIVKFIYRFIKKGILINLVSLYFITFVYYLISIRVFELRVVFYSFLPCIFYLIFNIIKYEMDKQNFNCYNYNFMCFNWYKKK